MTNYNERFDEVLEDFGVSCARQSVVTLEDANEAKQAITSLIKELVAEAKPEEYKNYYTTNPVEKGRRMGYNEAVREFEQNLLKALEEV